MQFLTVSFSVILAALIVSPKGGNIIIAFLATIPPFLAIPLTLIKGAFDAMYEQTARGIAEHDIQAAKDEAAERTRQRDNEERLKNMEKALLVEANASNDTLKAELKKAQEDLRVLQADQEEGKSWVAEGKKRIAERENDKATIAALKTDITEKNNEIIQLNQEVNDLETAMKETKRTHKAELRTKQQRDQKFQQSMDGIQQTIANLQQTIDELQLEADKDQETIDERDARINVFNGILEIIHQLAESSGDALTMGVVFAKLLQTNGLDLAQLDIDAGRLDILYTFVQGGQNKNAAIQPQRGFRLKGPSATEKSANPPAKLDAINLGFKSRDSGFGSSQSMSTSPPNSNVYPFTFTPQKTYRNTITENPLKAFLDKPTASPSDKLLRLLGGISVHRVKSVGLWRSIAGSRRVAGMSSGWAPGSRGKRRCVGGRVCKPSGSKGFARGT